MEIKQKIKRIVAGVALAASLLGTGSNLARANSAEVMVGNTSTTLDVKVGTKVAPKTSLFVRNRTTVDYENQVSNFGLADLSYNLIGGLDAVAEVQMIPGAELIPRVGLGYFNKVDDLNFYGLATAGLSGEKIDAEFFASLSYTPKIPEDLQLKLSLEDISNFGQEGHNFSIQRFRAGLGINQYEAGLATDLTEAAGEINPTVGAYAKINF